VLTHSPAARGAATPGPRLNQEDKTNKSYTAFQRCLSAMPQVQPTLTRDIGLKIRCIKGLEGLESLRWGSETLLLSIRSLDLLQDIISAGNTGLMRGIHTLGIFMPAQVTQIREFVTLLDGWLVWSGSAHDLKLKLDLAATGYAIVAPAMISAMAADQHRLTLLNTLTEAHLSLLPLLAEGMTDDELAKSRGATLPTTKLLVRQLLARLQCRNRTEAAIFAWRHTGTLAQLCSSPEASKPQPPDFLKSDGASNAV
jgi:DNA-binding CsgD family transcriptional regulator